MVGKRASGRVRKRMWGERVAVGLGDLVVSNRVIIKINVIESKKIKRKKKVGKAWEKKRKKDKKEIEIIESEWKSEKYNVKEKEREI